MKSEIKKEAIETFEQSIEKLERSISRDLQFKIYDELKDKWTKQMHEYEEYETRTPRFMTEIRSQMNATACTLRCCIRDLKKL